jgi:hypothetical protein
MKYTLIIIIFGLLVSCDGGLEPKPQSFLTGQILFSSQETWPPKDSLIDLRLVALKNFPPSDIVTEVVSGNAYFSETLPFYMDSVSFQIEISDAPVELKYIGVAQNYGEILDWRVVGVYSADSSAEHSSVFISTGETKEIVIYVDFNNIPEQPFEL